MSRDWAVIRVSDTGAGIRKSNLARLFERFYRGDKARLAGGAKVLSAISSQTTFAPLSATSFPTQVSPRSALSPSEVIGGNLGLAGAFGIVSTVNGSSVTVAGARGVTRTLTIGSATRVIVVGVTAASVDDIKSGDKVLVLGLRRGIAALESRAVIAAPADYTKANVIIGRLDSSTADSLLLQTAAGQVTVTLDSQTEIYGHGLHPAHTFDLVHGNYVIVIGQQQNGGALGAQLVLSPTGSPAAQRPLRLPTDATPDPGQ